MDTFARKVAELNDRILELRRQAGAGKGTETALVDQALASLQDAVEELHVMQEELFEQNQELQIARNTIEEERARYEDLFEFAPDGYLVTDTQGVIREANQAAAGLLGSRKEQLIGQQLAMFVERIEERRTFEKGIAHLLAGAGQPEFQTWLKGREQQRFCASMTAAIIRDRIGQPSGLRWLIRDVTQRAQEEEERRLRLAAIVESSDDAIIGKSFDGIITSWNAGAERLYGYTREEALGRPISLIIPPERDKELVRIFERIRRGEKIEPYETVRVRKDGTRVDVSVRISPIKTETGQITGASAIARDITKVKQAQEAMQAIQEAEKQRSVMLEAASRVALDILASRTGMEALRHIADAARTLAHARYAALGVARPDGQGLLEFATVGLSAPQEAAIGPRPKGAGILGLLLKRKDPLRIDNLTRHPASSGFPKNHPPMTSFLGVPIWREEVMLGSLYLTDKEGGGPFTEEDEVAVQALGDYAAVAIHNLHLLSRQRALVSGLIAAQEEERRAVAYDLHDGLTQYVMASHAHLEAFKRAHQAGNQEKAEREMEQGLRYLKEAVVESRRLVNGLRSLALDDLGLAGAVEQLLADEKVRAGWQEADLIHNIAGRRFDATLETAAYRVAQEAITNARKHADTTSMRVTLQFCSEEPESLPYLHLEIRDWGKGFVPEEKIGLVGHVGLQGMAERVSLLGGTYTLESAPQAGTVVRATFPLLEAAQED